MAGNSPGSWLMHTPHHRLKGNAAVWRQGAATQALGSMPATQPERASVEATGPSSVMPGPCLASYPPPLTTTLLSYLRRTILPHAASLCMPGSLRRTTAAHTSPLQPGTVRQAGAAGAAVVCRRVLAAGAAQALFLPPASQPPEDAPKTHTRPPTSLPLPHTLPPPSASAHPGALCSSAAAQHAATSCIHHCARCSMGTVPH